MGRQPGVVRIEERHVGVTAARAPRLRAVAGPCRPPGRENPSAEPFRDVDGIIGQAVIDHQRFRDWKRLCPDRFQRVGEECRRVVAGDHGRYYAHASR